MEAEGQGSGLRIMVPSVAEGQGSGLRIMVSSVAEGQGSGLRIMVLPGLRFWVPGGWGSGVRAKHHSSFQN